MGRFTGFIVALIGMVFVFFASPFSDLLPDEFIGKGLSFIIGLVLFFFALAISGSSRPQRYP